MTDNVDLDAIEARRLAAIDHEGVDLWGDLSECSRAVYIAEAKYGLHVNIIPDSRCQCSPDVTPSTYGNQVSLDTPEHMRGTFNGVNTIRDTICVDACLEDEIKQLWARGFITTGCCCGHQGKAPAYIGLFASPTALTAEVRRLREALAPFAKLRPDRDCLECVEGGGGASQMLPVDVGYILRAREALKGTQP